MKKVLIGILLFPCFCFSQYNLNEDTTISTTWNLGTQILYVAPGIKIHGTGTIQDGYVQASLYQDIFDTTVIVKIKGGAYGMISTSWFGCSPSKANNTVYFQRAIDASKSKDMTMYTPGGIYKDSSALLIADTYNGDYTGVSLKWKGEYVFNMPGSGSQINYLNNGNFALGIQKGKGIFIEGISLVGKFASANKADPGTNYYNIAYADYLDTTCTEYLSGVIVDPFTNVSGTGGSTGILFKDMYVSGFTTLFNISPTSVTLNAEEIIADRIVFGRGRTGWLNGQSQEKQNVIMNSMAWSGLHTLFYASYQVGTGNYHIHDINVAGSVINLFYINQSGWFPTKIDHIYAESIGSVGTLYTSAMVISLTDCVFSFASKASAGTQYLVKSNNLKVRFNSCDFTYFGQSYDMTFSGLATFIGCSFSGAYTNSSQGSIFSSNCQFLN